jgi:hypothetical protein
VGVHSMMVTITKFTVIITSINTTIIIMQTTTKS